MSIRELIETKLDDVEKLTDDPALVKEAAKAALIKISKELDMLTSQDSVDTEASQWHIKEKQYEKFPNLYEAWQFLRWYFNDMSDTEAKN